MNAFLAALLVPLLALFVVVAMLSWSPPATWRARLARRVGKLALVLAGTVVAGAMPTTTPASAGLIDGVFSKQTVAYAAAITPDPTQGAVVMVGVLTGAITVNNPTAGLVDGAVLIFHFQQDATSGRVVTWGSAFKQTFTPTTTANLRNVIGFIFDSASGFWIEYFERAALPA